MKHTLAMLVPILLSFALTCAANAGVSTGRKLFKFQSKSDFRGFELSGARWDTDAGGMVFQSKGAETDEPGSIPHGMVESPVVEIGFPTDEFVLSWNSITPPESFCTIYIQVRSKGFWSRKFAYAIWNRDNKPVQRMTMTKVEDDLATLEQDILTMKTQADAFRVSVKLSSRDGKTYPTLRMLTVHCLSRTVVGPKTRIDKAVWGTDIDVPQRSQLTVPEGNRFCSATCSSMDLEYWAHKLNRPELNMPLQQAVDGIYDYEAGGTGTWPFNTAFAGEFGGLRGFVTRLASMADAERWIAKGVPVILSIDHNVLRGTPEKGRGGHLILLRGFDENGDCIVNDPYTFLDKGEVVRRVFNRKLVTDAWIGDFQSSGTAYLIYPDGWDVPRNTISNW